MCVLQLQKSEVEKRGQIGGKGVREERETHAFVQAAPDFLYDTWAFDQVGRVGVCRLTHFDI